MRYLASAVVFAGLALAAHESSADKATVVADCKTAITSSTAAGIGIRVVTGGAVPGTQAYVHALPSTNSRTKVATFVGAVEVRSETRTIGNAVETVIAATDRSRTFHLTIRRETAYSEPRVVLDRAELGGRSFGRQSLVCTLAALDVPGPGAGLGKLCGGIAGIPCAEGLTCQMTGPSHPDQAGICVRAGAGLGKLCGGFAGIPCAEGLTCLMSGPPHPDQAGICARAGAGLGRLCGGIAGIPCAEGLICRMTGPSHPDQAGICVRR
jgi:hypothetical protein